MNVIETRYEQSAQLGRESARLGAGGLLVLLLSAYLLLPPFVLSLVAAFAYLCLGASIIGLSFSISSLHACALLRAYESELDHEHGDDDDEEPPDNPVTALVPLAPPRGSRDRLFGPDRQPESERTHEYWNGSRVRHRLLPDRSSCPTA